MVKIISDSTCDLSQELLRKYEIDILPLHILLGDKEYEDGKNITVTGVAAGSTSFKVKDSEGHEKTVSVTVNPKQVANGKVLEGGKTYIFEIPADKQENIKKLEVSFKDYPTNKSNDGVDV